MQLLPIRAEVAPQRAAFPPHINTTYRPTKRNQGFPLELGVAAVRFKVGNKRTKQHEFLIWRQGRRTEESAKAFTGWVRSPTALRAFFLPSDRVYASRSLDRCGASSPLRAVEDAGVHDLSSTRYALEVEPITGDLDQQKVAIRVKARRHV